MRVVGGRSKTNVAEQLISARLQVLQSKRLLFSSHERREGARGSERLSTLAKEVARAQISYEETMIRWGSTAEGGFWPAAYSRLIGLADDASRKLGSAASTGTRADAYAVAVEVELMDHLLGSWRERLRHAMKASA